MVPKNDLTNFLAISDHFWKKIFLAKKFLSSPSSFGMVKGMTGVSDWEEEGDGGKEEEKEEMEKMSPWGDRRPNEQTSKDRATQPIDHRSSI